MNLKKVQLFFLLLACLGLLVAFLPRAHQPPVFDRSSEELQEGCTVIMVGKAASMDGSTMATHTCDCGTCDWTWRHVAAADHKPGEMRKIYHINQYKTWPPEEGLKWDLYKKDFTGLEIPEVSHTYAYHHGMFGYMNEHQLAIGESTIGCVRKLQNPTPAPAFDITMLTLIAMERCRTAREAIQLMGSLAEKYGYGYNDHGEMLAVHDPNEVWVFEIMPVGPLWTPASGKPGAVWCAQRVPDEHVSVCPNESRIGEIDLDNREYFMASSHVVSFAIEQGLYDPGAGKPFSWKRAYSPAEGSAVSTNGRRARMWRFFNLVAPSLKLSPETPNMDYPFSVKPDRKISVQDVMNMTRDRAQGTPFDRVKGMRGGPFGNPNYFGTTRTICSPSAEYTTITQCRDWLPAPIGGIVWLAFGVQDTSCYMPLYAGISDVPDSFKIGDHWTFNRDSARWAFDYVDFHTQVVYSYALEEVKKAQEEWEAKTVAGIAEIDKQALERYNSSVEEGISYLTGYSLTHADAVVKAWWKLGDDLLVRFNKLGYYDPGKRSRDRTKPAYPDWWKKAIQIYDILLEPAEK
ncbi:MAG: dipeptidase [Candidatus Aminicenantales bacterium]